MIPALPTLALAGLLALGGPAYRGAVSRATATRPGTVDTLVGPGDAVPYVAQGPLLCGGASAAMVQRFWGALGVYADDYADLLDREAGGIRAGDLAAGLERRGYATEVLRDDPDGALERVRNGVPVIALLDGGAAVLHYVVIVAAGPDRIRYHDPLKAPGRTLSRTAFLRRWAASGYWALAALPGPSAEVDLGGDGAAGQGGNAAGDTAAAPLPAELRSALEALRSGGPGSAARAAGRVESWLAAAPADHPRRDLALEMLATARYLAGDAEGALRAWNPEGPAVDLVRVRGLEHLRYRTVVAPMGIDPGDVLTPRSLALARRRVLQLPSIADGRVAYRPLRNGAVRVEAAVAETPVFPTSVAEWGGLALGAAVNRTAALEAGPFLGAGERWRVAGQWETARSLAVGEVAVPWAPGASVVTVAGGWTEERFAAGPLPPAGDTASRSWGSATLRRWITPGARAGLTAGVERWDGGRRVARGGLSLLLAALGDRLGIGVAVDGWAGPRPAARVRSGLRVRTGPGSRTRDGEGDSMRPVTGAHWTLTLGGSLVSAGAPPTLWDGAGTGEVRGALLRGHPLVRDDAIGAAAFGRGLAHATIGGAWFVQAGPDRAAVRLFVDGARVWAPLVGGPRSYLDPGVELAVTSGGRTAALSLAHGDGWVVSLRLTSRELPWLRGDGR